MVGAGGDVGIAGVTVVGGRPRARVGLIVALAILATACGTWGDRSPSSFPRQEVSFTYSPTTGLFYLAGGSTVHESYDPATDSWTTVAPLPANLDHIQAVELEGRVYYIGGLASFPEPAVGTVYIYDVLTDTFATGAPMPAGRERGAGGVAVYDGKIYYAGGLHEGADVAWFDVYDPETDTWETLPDMSEARDHFHAAVVGDRFYAIGGRRRLIDATTTLNETFDMQTGSWVSGLEPLPTPRGGFAAAVLGSQVLVIGGEGGGTAHAVVEAYDATSDSWRPLAPMPTPRHGIQAAVCDGGVYIAAGGTTQGGGAPTDVHEVFFLGGATDCAQPVPS